MSPRNVETPWYTRDEAASYLRVSVRTLTRWREIGRLAAPTSGRFHRDDLDAALAKLPSPRSPIVRRERDEVEKSRPTAWEVMVADPDHPTMAEVAHGITSREPVSRETNEPFSVGYNHPTIKTWAASVATVSPVCTCEYPYPPEIWSGHHPHCGLEPEDDRYMNPAVSEDDFESAPADMPTRGEILRAAFRNETLLFGDDEYWDYMDEEF